VLKVTVREENGIEESVTVRLYGPNTDYVINRERELVVSLVSSHFALEINLACQFQIVWKVI